MKKWFIGVMGLLCMIKGVQATGSIVIWPIDPVIESTEQASAVWLENQGSTPIVLQIRVLGWQQSQFEENYQPQQTVIASPPMANVQPGKRQLIRLIKTQSPAPGQEQAFRLLIDEISVPVAQASAITPQSGLQLQMRYSIPLFIAGEQIRLKSDQIEEITAPRLSGKMVEIGNKKYLHVINQGAVHARISNVTIGGHSVAAGLLGYVLPGMQMRWPINTAAKGEIKAKINDFPNRQILAP
jgi:fimbrial chaperone protein